MNKVRYVNNHNKMKEFARPSTKEEIAKMKLKTLEEYEKIRKVCDNIFTAVSMADNSPVIIARAESFKSKQELPKLDCSHVLKLLAVIRRGQYKYFVCEHHGTTLLDYANEHKGRLEESKVKSIFRQIIRGYQVFHASHALHRHLHPQNIFIRDEAVKIGLPGNSVSLYSAPEEHFGVGETGKADVWSIGAVAYFLLHGHPPFKHRDSMESGKCFARKGLSSGLMDLVYSCLRYDPEERISFEELREHPFLSDSMPKSYKTPGKLINPESLPEIPCELGWRGEKMVCWETRGRGEMSVVVRKELERKLLIGGKIYRGAMYLCRCGEENDVLLACDHYLCIGCTARERIERLNYEEPIITCPYCKIPFRISNNSCKPSANTITMRLYY